MKVICINDKDLPDESEPSNLDLKKGEMYTVVDAFEDAGEIYYCLLEDPEWTDGGGFNAKKFVPAEFYEQKKQRSNL